MTKADPRIILPNEDVPLDRTKAQDRTGQKFLAGPKTGGEAVADRALYDPTNFMRDPRFLKCKCGRSDRLRILAEAYPAGEPLVQIVCGRCGRSWPVMKLGIPDMNDFVAKKLGLYVPDQPRLATVEVDVDVER